jgi:hypothetical protein
MRKSVFWCCFFLHSLYTNAQSLQHADMLGETPVIIHKEIQDSLFDFSFVHVHANEITALNTVRLFLQSNKGSLFYLQHAEERNISFMFHDTVFEFDPNRMFTGAGRKTTLNPYSNAADSIVQKLATDILSLLESFAIVVALHNNTPSNYSVKSYRKGGIFEKEAAKYYINKKMDEDDFIFTTDEDIFNRCKKIKINVVLQDNRNCTDDGSLSVYYADKNVCYINIEAENDHTTEQLRMLRFIYGIIIND